MSTQTEIFTRRIEDCLQQAVALSASTTCYQLVQRISAGDASAAFVVDDDTKPLGIITERDVSRRVAFDAAAETPVSEMMSTPVECIAAERHLHEAVARMRRCGVRHLGVLRGGRLVGQLELGRALAALAAPALRQIDLLCPLTGSDDDWRLAKQNQHKVALALLEDGVPPAQVQQLLTRLNNELYRAAATACEQQLNGPPAPYALLVMGSGGRGENMLYPDQDNGLIVADDLADGERWFAEFGERLNQRLMRIGFPLCRGGVMAGNAAWCKSLSGWRCQTDDWITDSTSNDLRMCDIFFDFAHVYGDPELSQALREHVSKHAARPFFLREMFKADEAHDVALGPFGLLWPDREPGPNKGKLGLKMNGTLPLVGALRVLALRHQVSATSTLQRLERLRALGALYGDEYDELGAAYQTLVGLLLRQQLRDVDAGLVPGNHIARSTLSRRERRSLVDTLRAIRRFRSRLRTELTGELY